MACSPGLTDAVKLQTSCISCRETVVGLDAYCILSTLNESRHIEIILSSVVYDSLTLNVHFC